MQRPKIRRTSSTDTRSTTVLQRDRFVRGSPTTRQQQAPAPARPKRASEAGVEAAFEPSFEADSEAAAAQSPPCPQQRSSPAVYTTRSHPRPQPASKLRHAAERVAGRGAPRRRPCASPPRLLAAAARRDHVSEHLIYRISANLIYCAHLT